MSLLSFSVLKCKIRTFRSSSQTVLRMRHAFRYSKAFLELFRNSKRKSSSSVAMNSRFAFKTRLTKSSRTFRTVRDRRVRHYLWLCMSKWAFMAFIDGQKWQKSHKWLLSFFYSLSNSQKIISRVLASSWIVLGLCDMFDDGMLLVSNIVLRTGLTTSGSGLGPRAAR